MAKRIFRRRTAAFRKLPSIIILGAQKAGTSSLYHLMAPHPQLAPSFRKEVHFFDGGLKRGVDTYARGVWWYRSNFPLRSCFGRRKAFEASPLYLFHPLAPKRIHSLLPTAKLIVLLRDPAERAISHYFHNRRERGGKLPVETLPLRSALRAEEDRIAPALASRNFNHPSLRFFSYKQRGIYHEQLSRYFAVFPREQILLLKSEDFFVQREKTIRRVFEFCEVTPDLAMPNMPAKNVGRNKEAVEADVYDGLRSFFQPHNERLAALTGIDFGW